MTVEELQVIITAKTEGIRNEIDNVNKQMESVNKQSEKAGEGIKKAFAASGKAIVAATKAIAVGVVAGGAALLGMAVKSAEYCANIDDMAQRTGLSAKSLQEWKYVAEQSGTSMETITKSATKLTVFMGKVGEGNKEATETFKGLGINVKDASGHLKSTEQIFPQIIDKLAGMSNETERNALTMSIFGKSAAEMGPILNAGASGIKDMKDEAQKLGLVLSDDMINAGATFDDSFAKMKASLAAVVTTVGAQVMPIIQKFMDWVMAHMPQIQAVISEVFKVIQDIVKGAADIFMTNLLPILKTVFDWVAANMPQIKENIKAAFDGLKPVFEALKDAIKLVVDVLVTIGTWMLDHQEVVAAFAIVIGSFAAAWGLVNLALGIWNIVAGIGTVVTGALAGAVAILTSPITLVILAIGAVIAIAVLLWKNWDTIKAKAAELGTAISTKFTEIKTNISTIVDNIKTAVVDKFNSIKSGAATAFNNVKDAVLSPIVTLKDKVKDIVEGIKGFFTNLKITIPKIKMPHFSIKGSFSLAPPSIPTLGVNWYAQGGVFDKATTIGVGENGREAVMPLERNTGWITELAGKINGSMGQSSGSNRPVEVVLQIGSTQLGKVVIDSINKLQRQEGRILLDI